MWNWNNGGGNNLMSDVNNLDTIIKTGNDLVQLIQGVKGLLSKPNANPQAFQPQGQRVGSQPSGAPPPPGQQAGAGPRPRPSLPGMMDAPQAGQTPNQPPSAPAATAPPSDMEPFRPQIADPYAGGNQWLPAIQQVAAQFGNSWVPTQTQGLGGVDLTGIWCPPGNPMDQTYIRQFGPYLNLVAGIMGMQTAVGEGLYDPEHRSVYIIGVYFNGARVEVRSQLLPNWTMRGVMIVPGPMGFPVKMPHIAVKVA